MTQIIRGDCLDILPRLPPESVDAVITDPPYGIGFMGSQWDQPGKYQSSHRPPHLGERALTAGTTGRDHKTTSQRSANMVAGRYDRSPQTNLKYQEWCAAWAANCYRLLKPGGHLIAFGGTRTFHRLVAGVEDAGFQIRDALIWLYGNGMPKSLDLGDGWGTALKPGYEPATLARKPPAGTTTKNHAQYGTGGININAIRGEGGQTTFDRQPKPNSGIFGMGTVTNARPSDDGRWPANVTISEQIAAELDNLEPDINPSRFYYTAKASDAERITLNGITHPTVKPLTLIRWICRGWTPAGGTILDPFAGSGTLAEAALLEGFQSVNVEREAGYVDLIHQRIRRRRDPIAYLQTAGEDLGLFTQTPYDS